MYRGCDAICCPKRPIPTGALPSVDAIANRDSFYNWTNGDDVKSSQSAAIASGEEPEGLEGLAKKW
jgi:hypothetical protein